jgi:gamma-glutamyl phosphate reductase
MTLYTAFVKDVDNKYSDAKIDQIHFDNIDEAIEFIIDEYEHKHAIMIDKDQIHITERASQRIDKNAFDHLGSEEW